VTPGPRFEGTPKSLRSKQWIFPNRSRRILWVSLGAGAAIAVVMIGGYFAGVRGTLSPGPVASQHASFDLKCAQCHEAGNAVTAVRCERCHDATNSQRLTHAAHILIGTGDPIAMENAEERPCQTCHVEHRGLNASLRAVDDRECGACHKTDTGAALRSFDGHPEFAVVRARATPGVGLKFGHARHLIETQNKRGTTCSVCHEQTADRRAFLPMNFDRHCSACHTKGGILSGETENVIESLVVLPDDMPASVRGQSAPRIERQPDGTVKAAGLRHRDQWVVYNALRLRSGIDPEGEEAEQLLLRGQIGYLDALLRWRPNASVRAENLETEIAALDAEIADIDQKLARPASPQQDQAALAELAGSTRAIAEALLSVNKNLEEELRDLSQPTPLPDRAPASSDADASGSVEGRKQELTRLLDAVDARTSDPALQKRAASLRSQVEALSSAGGGSGDEASLLVKLQALEPLVRSVRKVPDPGVQTQLAQIDLIRRYAQQRISEGLRPDDFDGRRRELLSVLDAIDARGLENLQVRSSALRQRLLAVRPGSVGDKELRRVRTQRARQRQRLALELELMRSPREQEPAPAQDAGLDRPAIDSTLARLRATLAALESSPRMEDADDQLALDDRKDAFQSLLGTACLKCHDIDASGARFAPVRAAEPVMPRSIFNHAPHVTRASCDSCHGSIAKSTEAVDVNVPGKAVCATCHAPAKTRDDCETCHVYHPASPAKMVSLTP
jgi:hypothetical protein